MQVEIRFAKARGCRQAGFSKSQSDLHDLAASPRLVPKPLAAKAKFEISDGVEFDLNPLVLAISFLGWSVPGLLPSNIPLYGGKGLTTALFAEISEHLAKFPVSFFHCDDWVTRKTLRRPSFMILLPNNPSVRW